MQLEDRRPVRHLERAHAGVPRHLAALFQVAGRARGHDVVPARLPAARARDQVIEREVLARIAILAREAISQEHVEPREGRIKRWFDVCFERDDGREPHLEARAPDRPVVLGDDVDAIQKDGLHRLLPAPERQRIVAQGPEVGVENQCRKRFRRGSMSIHELASSRFVESGRHPRRGVRILATHVSSVKVHGLVRSFQCRISRMTPFITQRTALRMTVYGKGSRRA